MYSLISVGCMNVFFVVSILCLTENIQQIFILIKNYLKYLFTTRSSVVGKGTGLETERVLANTSCSQLGDVGSVTLSHL